MSSSRWRRAGSSPSTADEDKSEEELIDEEVVAEIGSTHPIVYDTYDLCDYVKEEKLNYVTVPCLRKSVLSWSTHLNGSRAEAWGEGNPKN